LPPYHAAIDAGAGSVMTSFNEIGGVPSTASPWLMTALLRREWGFKGFVVSDWTAINELLNHGVAGSRADAGKLALEAGVDMDMVSRIYVDDLPALVRAGRIPGAVVNEAVRRVPRAGSVNVVYAKGCGITDTTTAGFAEAVAAAKQADVAVLVLGEAGDMSGEAASRADIDLPGVQQQLLEAIHASGTRVVLVVMSGRPLTIPWAAEHVPAIVESWFLGIEDGPALAAVLFGDVSPSGKLP